MFFVFFFSFFLCYFPFKHCNYILELRIVYKNSTKNRHLVYEGVFTSSTIFRNPHFLVHLPLGFQKGTFVNTQWVWRKEDQSSHANGFNDRFHSVSKPSAGETTVTARQTAKPDSLRHWCRQLLFFILICTPSLGSLLCTSAGFHLYTSVQGDTLLQTSLQVAMATLDRKKEHSTFFSIPLKSPNSHLFPLYSSPLIWFLL